ncbi:MAG: UDP-N-acetylmuramate dehydrogenase [Planctomycetaceae bacterium]|nr:UDP-N-acetylmuramate dehydrogenase [Planctomycetaceae bacterium]
MIVASPSSLYSDLDVTAELDAPLGPHTWFGIGGRADLLIHPNSVEALATLVARCRRDGIPLRVLGSGANLLVDDDGVDGVVVKLDTPYFKAVEYNAEGPVQRVRAFGGASMEALVQELPRRGLTGLEQMAGIPASVGGAIRMNAGGKFGAVGDAVDAVAMILPDGSQRVFRRDEIEFGYRHTNLPKGIVAWASFIVREDDPAACRERVKEYFKYKKSTQPMDAASAGCMFKNPTMPDGSRESAGRLIDLAGLKGLRVGHAFVSDKHGNFLGVELGATTAELCALIEAVQQGVKQRHGVDLETEVVYWKRGEGA